MRENAAKMDSCHIRNVRPKGGSARDRSSQSVQHDQAKDRPKEKTRETPFCLNKKTCNGKKHFLKDCPSTSKQEAHQLFDERRLALKVRRAKIKEAKAEKRRKLERVKKAKIMQQHDVRKCKSAILFMLEGMLIDAATEDTGADATVVPDKVVAKMEQRGLVVERIKLEKALVFMTARAVGPEITWRTKIIVKRLICQVRGVSVVFRNATLFVSNDIEEMLIGRDILHKTGFSFAEHLTKNVGTLNEMDLSSEGTNEQALPEASSQYVGSISRLAAFGGYERYEGEFPVRYCGMNTRIESMANSKASATSSLLAGAAPGGSAMAAKSKWKPLLNSSMRDADCRPVPRAS
jgi:hypothetical protein